MSAVLTEKIDMSGLGVSAGFRDVLERATARRPDDRFPDAGAFRNALRQTPELKALHTAVTITPTLRDMAKPGS